MGRFYWLREDRAAATRAGGYVNAAHRWGLPGLLRCPTCSATWASTGHYYPGVDLSRLDEEREFRKARPEPLPEFSRLRELVRPLAPSGAQLPPGTRFGPLQGTGRGQFPDVSWLGDIVLVQRRVLDGLQAAGLSGVQGFSSALKFRAEQGPDLRELQMPHHGQLHPDCVPPDSPPPCQTCGRWALGRPEEPVLDGTSLPSDLDLFRVGNFATMVICTERFLDEIHRMECDGLAWRELPVRTGKAGALTALGGQNAPTR
ncbi:double-CXXCG motif protein [Myxococcus stipitatus]|uniref:SitI6 family double-CXXCG motif immunity protein n=1 Tax=Myxococcus stipitatus TaxID=83455 RepID=UPI0031454E12